jgi:hypothetical protein
MDKVDDGDIFQDGRSSLDAPFAGLELSLDDWNVPATIRFDLAENSIGGWIGKPGASPGRWSVPLDDDACPMLDSLPVDARAAIENRIHLNAGTDASTYLRMITAELSDGEPGPQAIILFPGDMPLSVHAMRMRRNLPDFRFCGYGAYHGWIES